MKYKYDIREISKDDALNMIRKYHYSNTLPKINKHFVGFYLNGELVGIVTLGWGTRPKHTIKKIFPSLDTQDYLEIGRMCMTDDMCRNSESQMLSQLIKYIKKTYPEVKVLFTWADGMLGKCGYVYQASNFIYCGFSGGEMYVKDGVKIHPRQMKSILLDDGQKDKRLTIRPTLEQMRKLGIRHYKGKQYKYIYFICSKTERRRLEAECLDDLSLPKPKDDDLKWRVRDLNTGKWVESNQPPYITDIDQRTKWLAKQTIELPTCSCCGEPMNQGYVIYDGEEYYCSDDCLHSAYGRGIR